MIVRFYDIVIDTLDQNGEMGLLDIASEFRLTVPERDLTEAVERAEHIEVMMDKLSEYTGYDICSFRYEVVNS